VVHAGLASLHFGVEGLLSRRIHVLEDLNADILLLLLIESKVTYTKGSVSELLDNIIVLNVFATSRGVVINHLYYLL